MDVLICEEEKSGSLIGLMLECKGEKNGAKFKQKHYK